MVHDCLLYFSLDRILIFTELNLVKIPIEKNSCIQAKRNILRRVQSKFELLTTFWFKKTETVLSPLTDLFTPVLKLCYKFCFGGYSVANVPNRHVE
ncbi:hypothetical protein DJ78_01205 [Halorubrum ezzemoulense]|uniref:Uncharacterized protein n=1 Tax=Halorubrum ezzemoulense TaxID=337243 RepID=A0A256JW89_HALEZ|nr:hypothetical protein DJ78_01205 [Halorubrum ezzemoulense]